MKKQHLLKCHNCKGKGFVVCTCAKPNNHKFHQCLHCKGTGKRNYD